MWTDWHLFLVIVPLIMSHLAVPSFEYVQITEQMHNSSYLTCLAYINIHLSIFYVHTHIVFSVKWFISVAKYYTHVDHYCVKKQDKCQNMVKKVHFCINANILSGCRFTWPCMLQFYTDSFSKAWDSFCFSFLTTDRNLRLIPLSVPIYVSG